LFSRDLTLILLGNGLGDITVLFDGPIEDIIVLKTLTNGSITEDLAEVQVVRLVIETKGTSVLEVDGELIWEAIAKDLSWSGELLLHDIVVLLLLSRGLVSLPWEGSTL